MPKYTIKKIKKSSGDDIIPKLLEKLNEETAMLRVKMLKSLMGVKTYNATMKNGGKGMTIKSTPQASPTEAVRQDKQIISYRSEPLNEESPIVGIEILETVAIDVKKPSVRIIISGRNLSTDKLAEYTKMVYSK